MIRIFVLIATTAIAVAKTNIVTPSSTKSKKYLTMSRFAFRTPLRRSYNKLITKLHDDNLYSTTIQYENQRMAFIRWSPIQRSSRTIAVKTDTTSVNFMDTENQYKIASPLQKNTKQSAIANGFDTRLYHSSPQRNFFNKRKNDNDDKSLVGQAKKIAKKFLPSTWFQSEEERRQIAQQKQMQKEIQTGIQQVFKDAPLPVRMLTNMVGSLFGSVASSLAETVASQQSLIDIVYDQAVQSIQTDSTVQGLLGDSITVGRPFSQSSSSSSINGVTSTRIELAFPVAGRLGNGVGRLSASGGANNPIVDSLVVQVNGRVVDVNIGVTSFNQRIKSDQPNNPHMKDKSNIIDAEIIEKDTKK